MAEERHLPIEEMDLFKGFESVSDRIWSIVRRWDSFARDTMGKQLVRAADSIGANLVEGDGRFSTADALQFFVIARASARETRYWLKRAAVRDLIAREAASELAHELIVGTRMLNALITFRRDKNSRERIREHRSNYLAGIKDALSMPWPDE